MLEEEQDRLRPAELDWSQDWRYNMHPFFSTLLIILTSLLGPQSSFAEVGTFLGTCSYDTSEGANLQSSCIQISDVFEARVGTVQQDRLSLYFVERCNASDKTTVSGVNVNPIWGANGEVLGYRSADGREVLMIDSLAGAISTHSGQSTASYKYFADPDVGAKPDRIYQLHCSDLRAPPPKDALIPAH